MFETSQQSEELVQLFARASAHPVSNSAMGAVYDALPNDTDFTVFKRAGIPGLNFAFIEGAASYHTSTDDPEHLDERSAASWRAGSRHRARVRRGDIGAARQRHLLRSAWQDRRRLLVADGNSLPRSGVASGAVAAVRLAVWEVASGSAHPRDALVIPCHRRCCCRRHGRLEGAHGLESGNRGLVAFVHHVDVVRDNRHRRRGCGRHRGLSAPDGETDHDRRTHGRRCDGGRAAGRLGNGMAATGELSGRMAAGRSGVGVARSVESRQPRLAGSPHFHSSDPCRSRGGAARLSGDGGIAARPVGRGRGIGRHRHHTHRALVRHAWQCPRVRVEALALASAVGFVACALPALFGSFDAERPRQNHFFYALDAELGEAIWGSADATVDEWTRARLGDTPQQQALPAFILGSTRKYLVAKAPVENSRGPR